MRRLVAVLTLLPASTAAAAVEGPVERVASAGSKPDVVARADGSALVAWETTGTPNLRVCRIAPSGGGCAADSTRSLDGPAGSTSRPFLFALSGGRVVVVQGGCCPQSTLRFGSADDGATFAPGVDFASLVPADQGAALDGETVQLLGGPATGGVRYQQAPVTGAGKVTQEATLDGATGIASYAVSSDGGRPIAAWAGTADGAFSTSPAGGPNAGSSWATPGALAGVTAVRLAGPQATWVRAGVREVARWTGSAFAAATPLPYAAAGGGEADLDVDASGVVHLAFSPEGSGAVCSSTATAAGAWSAPVLLARDTDGVTGLQVSATGDGRGRVVYANPGGVSTVPLAATTLTPNVCGRAPAALRLDRRQGSAGLRVALDPQGQDTTWRVEYGADTAYGRATADVAVPSGAGPVTAIVELADLEPGRTHHARLSATNATGTATSEDLLVRAPARLVAVSPAQVIGLPARCTRGRARVVLRRRAGALPVLARVAVTGRRPRLVGSKRLRDGAVLRARVPRAGGRVRVAVRLDDGRVLRRARAYPRC